MTATALHAALIAAGCPPRIDGPDVVFDSPPPVALARYLPVLLTGVRAVATGQRCGRRRRKRPGTSLRHCWRGGRRWRN